MVHTIVILGASYAGLAVSHRLLKRLNQHPQGLRVVLVSKNTHFYWNMAAIRAIVPGALPDTQLFQPIEPGFAQYPTDSFQFVLGTATAVDTMEKTATIVTAAGDTLALRYTDLVLATGARAAHEDMPWKASGSVEETRERLQRAQKRVGEAQHIVVAGAGPTGVETAAGLRYAFKDKEVVLLVPDKKQTPQRSEQQQPAPLLYGDSLAPAAERGLLALGVRIRRGARVQSAHPLPSGKTRLVLASGDTLTTDCYLPATGLVPNTDFLPPSMLHPNTGYVAVDSCLRVRGYDRVWACGDVVSSPRAGFMIADHQAAGVAKNIERCLQDREPVAVKGLPVDLLFVTMGRDHGVGRAGYLPLPSFLVWLAKGRTLGLQWMPSYVDGSRW